MSRVTVAQLEAFYWTATLGSVQRAAQHLNISQPAISLRLRELETGTGLSLFDRSGRALKVSLSGQSVMHNARAVLENIDRLSSHGDGVEVRGRIRVGFAEGFAMVCLPLILDQLHARYPELYPELLVATSSTIEPDLYESRIDLAILVEPTERADFVFLPLGAQQTRWVAAPHWQIPELARPADLVHIPIISNQPGTIGYRQVVRWFSAAGITLARIDICSSVATQARLIEAGTGIGILPVKMVEEKAARGELHIVESVPALEPVPVFVIHHKENLSPHVQAVIACVRDTLAGLDYLR
jgi:DNA-binding transcriptional LysR family regulator